MIGHIVVWGFALVLLFFAPASTHEKVVVSSLASPSGFHLLAQEEDYYGDGGSDGGGSDYGSDGGSSDYSSDGGSAESAPSGGEDFNYEQAIEGGGTVNESPTTDTNEGETKAR